MKALVLGGDGFCGWPTVLRLANNGMEVCLVDNLSRRAIDNELGTASLTPIKSIQERVKVASKLFAPITFVRLDVAKDYAGLEKLIRDFGPDAIVQFAEQRAAPYSMIGDEQRRYTVDNNVTGTHNICSAIVNANRDIHLVHLGTMGVYGYTKAFGPIPEGYLDVTINSTGSDASILYPANPGSVYHMTKCLDQLLFQFYNKNWGLRVTDLHQGIVWGVDTVETKLDASLVNRFDYDGVYGTVLNRFISQAANGVPLTIYGTGGQTRAFININDTAECVKLAIENSDFEPDRVRIFNQVAETKRLSDLAEIISNQYGAEISYIENPRKELAENDLEVSNEGLVSLGFSPILLDETLVDDVHTIAAFCKGSFDRGAVLNSPKW
ncbi:UDP-sulfoquinovose synthase [Luminiphilus syltensis NOR5-1B]|uniref:UDP-sulfoquinovose synthase n=1 Tax=Luminiphilus syltensis NOR5-1B TaxID=565045 RepID=B8KUZ2_9GAMM|nr:NAD-dependent epimerase/dehydratase family protein [Luminiphilus syltensis]EED35483.1 UDP-sulfoquinovose synthase [Luminiphilus syltensis NOR5-1B]